MLKKGIRKMPFHLRYTPYDLSCNNLTAFCDKYDKYIIARERHSKNGEECPVHYHIYIESDLNIDTIRGDFLKKLSIPKSGMGRNNKYYMLKAWNDDVSYICKQGDIVACKGFDKESLRVPPDPQKEEKRLQVSAAAPPAAKKKETNFWAEIFADGIFWEKTHKKKIETEDALKIISLVYIKKLLPLPHPGDRKRWATSLVMYSRMNMLSDPDAKPVDEIIEEEIGRFIGEHMCSNKEV